MTHKQQQREQTLQQEIHIEKEVKKAHHKNHTKTTHLRFTGEARQQIQQLDSNGAGALYPIMVKTKSVAI